MVTQSQQLTLVQELILDPDPTTDAGGLVIIKGDLQIDGTTTTVNSVSMSVNDPTIELGDPTTPVTLTASGSRITGRRCCRCCRSTT